MNSKRALLMLMVNQKKLKDGWKLTDLNTLESLSIEECYEIVMEDLELLEILKKHYDVNFLEVSPNYFIAYSVYKDDEDFKKVKEWLEDE